MKNENVPVAKPINRQLRLAQDIALALKHGTLKAIKPTYQDR